MAVKNTCTGNAFGPPEQTLFLGCSVASFSVQAGWNEQIGELTVQVVQDPCPVPAGGNPKVYWDANLTRQTTMAADPGFVYPNIGSACYFRVGDFEWCGLVQSFQENDAISGKPTYTVKLIDPRQILEGTQLIVGNYAGDVGIVSNLINVYGFAESYGNYSPPNEINGAVFGSPAGGFGGALANDNGMPWYVVQAALGVLTASAAPYQNIWSPYGRLVFRDGLGAFSGQAPSATIGYGIIPGDGTGKTSYLLDLSDMPGAPPYWKLAGTNISIMEAITQICQDAMCDFYIELLPTLIDTTMLKVIKVRSVSRAVQPLLNQISTFITNQAASGDLIQYSIGQEMRNETASAFIVGGNQQNIYQAYQSPFVNGDASDIICPFFGVDPITGNVIQPYTDINGIWRFNVDLTLLNAQLSYPLTINSALITEYELLAALGGIDMWFDDDNVNGPGDIARALDTSQNAITNPAICQVYIDNGIAFTGDINKGIPPIDFYNLNENASTSVESLLEQDKQKAYQFVLSFARDYYGKRFMVQLPYTTAKIDPESAANNGQGIIQTTEVPSDGGWTDFPDVLGLQHPTIYTDFFTLQDNRLGCFVGVEAPSGIDATMINPEDVFVTYNENTLQPWAYVRAQAEPELVYLDRFNFVSPRVVVSLSQPILVTVPENYSGVLRPDMAGLPTLARNKNETVKEVIKRSMERTAGGSTLWDEYPKPPKMITAAAIPIKSNVQTYGPWYTNAAFGITRMEQDNGLVPWEYGSTSNMNYAGYAKALNSITQANAMQVGEMGSIEVPGYPTIPIGAELGAYAGGVFGAGTNLVEHRSFASTTPSGLSAGLQHLIVDNGGQWTGLYGPNITSINVQVGIGAVQTSYGMRTFTSSFGRFSRGNAERLKERAQGLLRGQKQMRLAQLNMQRIANVGIKQGAIDKRLEPISQKIKSKLAQTHTPHVVFVGQSFPWKDGSRRHHVISEPPADIIKELRQSTDFQTKAIMSFDAFLRPVSVAGGNNTLNDKLPRHASVSTGAQFCSPGGSMPPLLIPTGENSPIFRSAYNLRIDRDYLNPFNTNPSAMHGAASGHDITVLGFGELPPTGRNDSLNLYVRGSGLPSYADNDNYRYLALRGPVMIQGWGYDLDGKPVPNSADNENVARHGVYTNQNLTDEFMDDWMTKAHLWPVAPFDMRFDRRRGLWVAPPERKMVIGLVLQDIAPNQTGLCQLAYGSNLSDASGNALIPSTVPCWCSPRFRVRDRINKPLSQGAFVIAYYEPDLDEYWSVETYGGETTTTTTTPSPFVDTNDSCSGQCKWTWNSVQTVWNLEDDPCGPPASSVNTTTTSGSTTTTSNLCPCPSQTTTTSGSTTTSTTTTRPPCKCRYPDFCGTVNGECTYTYCATGTQNTDKTAACNTSTTTPSGTTTASGTTSTTVSGTTTTTFAPCDNGGCDYTYIRNYGWLLTGGGCGNPIDCAGRACACPAPNFVPDCFCGTAHTDCTTPPPWSNPSPTPCQGTSTWYWSDYYQDFIWAGDSCAGNPWVSCPDCLGRVFLGEGDNCYPVKPSSGHGDCCTPAIGGCQSAPVPTCNSTTTTASGTTTTTSTTTANPCGSGCKYQATSSGTWNTLVNNCSPSCHCEYPPVSPIDNGCQVYYGTCLTGTTTTASGTTTSTTTAAPTTTSTTTSTTTTTVWACEFQDDGHNNGCSANACIQTGTPSDTPANNNGGGLGWPTLDDCCAHCQCEYSESCVGCNPTCSLDCEVYNPLDPNQPFVGSYWWPLNPCGTACECVAFFDLLQETVRSYEPCDGYEGWIVNGNCQRPTAGCSATNCPGTTTPG